MYRVQLIHWDKEEAKEGIAALREAGYRVTYGNMHGTEMMRGIRTKPPPAVVIDLSRMPSQGRTVGMVLRSSGTTRGIPLVFVGGEAEKVKLTRRAMPDAAYTTWGCIGSALKRAIAKPPKEPVKPSSALAGYEETPLPKKLGIKPDMIVALVGAPKRFEKTLGKLPKGAKLRREARGRCELAIWFPTSEKDLKKRVKAMGRLIGDGGLWIAWPKQASGCQNRPDAKCSPQDRPCQRAGGLQNLCD